MSRQTPLYFLPAGEPALYATRGALPEQISVQVLAGEQGWRVQSDVAWLNLSAHGGSGDALLIAETNAVVDALQAGIYTARLKIFDDAGALRDHLDILLYLEKPRVWFAKSHLSLVAGEDAKEMLRRVRVIANSEHLDFADLHFYADQPWARVIHNEGDQAVIALDLQQLDAGTHQATFHIGSEGYENLEPLLVSVEKLSSKAVHTFSPNHQQKPLYALASPLGAESVYLYHDKIVLINSVNQSEAVYPVPLFGQLLSYTLMPSNAMLHLVFRPAFDYDYLQVLQFDLRARTWRDTFSTVPPGFGATTFYDGIHVMLIPDAASQDNASMVAYLDLLSRDVFHLDAEQCYLHCGGGLTPRASHTRYLRYSDDSQRDVGLVQDYVREIAVHALGNRVREQAVFQRTRSCDDRAMGDYQFGAVHLHCGQLFHLYDDGRLSEAVTLPRPSKDDNVAPRLLDAQLNSEDTLLVLWSVPGQQPHFSVFWYDLEGRLLRTQALDLPGDISAAPLSPTLVLDGTYLHFVWYQHDVMRQTLLPLTKG